MTKEINVECSYCEHQWKTNSKYKKLSCPSCGNKTLNTTLLGVKVKDKKTKLKFYCYGNLLEEYPLIGFNKGEVPDIMKRLSVVHNVPETNIQIIID